MYDQAAERAATAIRAIMSSKLSRYEKQAEVDTLIQHLEPASSINAIRSLLDSCDAVEKWLTSESDMFPSLPTGGVLDGEPLILIVNSMAWVSRYRVTGELQIDDQSQLVYESSVSIETARNWYVLEFDAWVELQSIQVGHVQHGYYPCSPALFSRAIFGK